MIFTDTESGQKSIHTNVSQVYPAGEFVEFYFAGFDTEFGGVDWGSLRLIFEQLDDGWYLVGIVHYQTTC